MGNKKKNKLDTKGINWKIYTYAQLTNVYATDYLLMEDEEKRRFMNVYNKKASKSEEIVEHSHEGRVNFDEYSDLCAMYRTRMNIFLHRKGVIDCTSLLELASLYELITRKQNSICRFYSVRTIRRGGEMRMINYEPSDFLRIISVGFRRVLCYRYTDEQGYYRYRQVKPTCYIGLRDFKKHEQRYGDGFVYDIKLSEMFNYLVGKTDYELVWLHANNQGRAKRDTEPSQILPWYKCVQKQGWIVRDKNYHYGNEMDDILVLFENTDLFDKWKPIMYDDTFKPDLPFTTLTALVTSVVASRNVFDVMINNDFLNITKNPHVKPIRVTRLGSCRAVRSNSTIVFRSKRYSYDLYYYYGKNEWMLIQPQEISTNQTYGRTHQYEIKLSRLKLFLGLNAPNEYLVFRDRNTGIQIPLLEGICDIGYMYIKGGSHFDPSQVTTIYFRY